MYAFCFCADDVRRKVAICPGRHAEIEEPYWRMFRPAPALAGPTLPPNDLHVMVPGCHDRVEQRESPPCYANANPDRHVRRSGITLASAESAHSASLLKINLFVDERLAHIYRETTCCAPGGRAPGDLAVGWSSRWAACGCCFCCGFVMMIPLPTVRRRECRRSSCRGLEAR